MLLMWGALAGWLLWRLAGRLATRAPARALRLPGPAARVAALGLGLGGSVALAWAVLQLSATTDWRVRRVVTLPDEIAELRAAHPFELAYALADRAAFAERVVYWRAGFAGFDRYPILGVGLGNAGFLFEQGLPIYAYRLVEIRRVLDPENLSFPNPKSLWIRLLSETGILGTAAFLTWVILAFGAAFTLAPAPVAQSRFIGVAGLLALPAWLLEGFSLDTFALPQTWVLLGLVTAGAWRARTWRMDPSRRARADPSAAEDGRGHAA
jgi:O-antigen ligase